MCIICYKKRKQVAHNLKFTGVALSATNYVADINFIFLSELWSILDVTHLKAL